MIVAALALTAPLTAPACTLERETTLSRVARVREVGELRAERKQLQAEIDVLRRTDEEVRAELAAAKWRVTATGAELRTTLATLRYDLDRLHRAELELAQAQERQGAIQQQLAALDAQQAELSAREAQRDQLAARGAQLAAEIDAAAKLAAAKEAELAPALAALQQRLQALLQLERSLRDADAAITAGAKALVPAPPPAAAPPAGTAPAAAAPAATAPAAPPAAPTAPGKK